MPKRKVPRYKLTVPLELTVLRAGVPDSIRGRSLEMGEGGMAVVAASQLLLGESVRVEFLLPHMSAPVRATAVVRYQRSRSFGLQFLRLPVEQQSIIRYWTRSEGDLLLTAQKPQPALPETTLTEAIVQARPLPDFADIKNSKRRFLVHDLVAFAIAVVVVAAVLGWWRWQQGWKALETQIPAKQTQAAKPQLKVPNDAMQQRIRHLVPPEYPEDARQAGVQGTVVLNAVVNPQGAVTGVKFVSGPEQLSPAAIDAVRWWRYEPYLVNGEPATVETTVAVDFRLAN
ncbi:MAG: TonB family protein [Terriglobales bacterium]